MVSRELRTEERKEKKKIPRNSKTRILTPAPQLAKCMPLENLLTSLRRFSLWLNLVLFVAFSSSILFCDRCCVRQ